MKQLYERFGKQVSVYPQFSQFTVKDDPRIDRVVHLTYRIGKRDLSYPPAGEPDHGPGRDAGSRPRRPARSRVAAAYTTRVSRPPVNLVETETMVKRGFRMHLPPYRTGALLASDSGSRVARRVAQRFFRRTLVDPPWQR